MSKLLPYGILAILLWKYAWPKIKSKEPKRFFWLDLPPFSLPLPGADEEKAKSFLQNFVQFHPVLIPPGIKIVLVWPIQLERTLSLKKEYSSKMVEAAVWAIREGILRTEITTTPTTITVNFPPMRIPY